MSMQLIAGAAWLTRSALRHPLLAIVMTIAATLLTTRVYTGIRFAIAIRKQRSAHRVHTVPIIPYWIPWIGHVPSFVLGMGGFLRKTAESLGPNASIYCLIMGNTKHNVVVSPSMAKQILVDRGTPISMEPMVLRTMEAFWDDGGAVRHMDHDAIWGPIHSALSGMMRTAFVDSAIPATVRLVEKRVLNMLTGAASLSEQASWERDGKAKVVRQADPSTGKPWVAELSLHPMMKNFVGNIATETLMGRQFLVNYPDIMNDLWTMDARFNAFMAGAPKWLPAIAPAARARERVINAIIDHHDALHRLQEGHEPESRWGDMSDCSTVMADRTKAWFAAKSPSRAYGGGDGAVFWAMNINANQVIFWLIWYAYSQPGLLQELRGEIAPYVQRAASSDDEVQIDLDSLWRHCPLLKGAFFETMRLEAASMSYKVAEQDFIVRESADDSKLLGKSEPESFELKKGEYICIPHVVHQSDGRYFRDPDRFDPRRFWVHDSTAEKQNGVSVDYKTMKVWGGGKQMCKGKTFAEREVVLFAAAVISAWEIEPVDGKWEHPGRIPTAGTVVPKKDVRVRMWTREGW